MSIRYDDEKKLFWLNAGGCSYVLGISPLGYPLHLYYGPALPEGDDPRYLSRRGWFDSLSPLPASNGDPLFSPDIAPSEYSGNGAGDFRLAAVQVRNAAGNTVTDPRYAGYEILSGKPALDGLPASFAQEDQAQTLVLRLEDQVTGLRLSLLYTVFADSPVIARSVRAENAGEAPLDLEALSSLCLELPDMGWDMLHLYGKWAKENSLARQPLFHGIQEIRSKRGMTGPNHNPFAAFARPDTGEEQGEAIGLCLVYSGCFSIRAEADTRGSTRVLAGIEPEDFRWRLEPGERFQSPEALLVYSSGGLGGMSRAFHRFILNHLSRSEWTQKRRPLLINSWEAAYFDFDGEKLISFARQAKALGMELLVMDDGWFGNRFDDHRSLGDWQVNEEKLGMPLAQLVRRVNEEGMAFGIWYEPEMISPDSDLYRAHPDWAVCAPGRSPSLSRWQCVLDMTRAEVRDYLFDQMSQVLSSCNIAYVKWDCNRHISEAASAALPPERQGEFFHRCVLGVYDLMDRITTAFPHILLENCSSGGGRFDAGMLYYSPQIWASDNTDALERLSIQFGASLCYPIASLGAHVSANPRTGIETRGNVALCGTFGYELDPGKLTDEEKAAVCKQTEAYRKYYDLIHYGDFYRITPPRNSENACCDWLFVSPDKKEALFTRVYFGRPENLRQILRLPGLDPARFYREEESGAVYSGALLAHGGLDLSPAPGTWPKEGDSFTRHFLAVD